MDSRPYLLVLSSNNTKPKSLIKLITKMTTMNEESSETVKQTWNIDTKYYTADISVLGIDKDFERSDQFNSQVEGLIVHLDANKDTGLKDLKQWESIENDCDPEVKILVANYCNEDTKITKTKVVDWCLKRNFEFIELYPSASSNDDLESDLQEKVGVERVIEVLHSHTWSNLKLKSQNKKITKVENKHVEKSKTVPSEEDIDFSDFQEDNLDDFTEIFSQLHTMRESLSSLPANQRKQCAEQMVTAFWKAIGGDEEELSDL
ncbi:hypothetical protein HHI36_010061 [Cryptolaemus montrouzieri]|uniref:Alpha-and gamma-adaptin-binding protein p34 n=1 Tax=Cryptolaemus montrouzieri TaxID=559131 RepID=A0ABD2MHM6_9CUCU